MTSAKKYSIQEFTTKLPDFLLQFVDANIRNDTYGALRSTHLTHKIDDLIPQHLEPQPSIWLFVDPEGKDHIIVNQEEFSNLSKSSESLPKKEKQLQKLTKQLYYSLQFQPKNILLSLLKQEKMNYLQKIKMISLDQIRLKCEANLYFQAEQLIEDIKKVIAWNQFYRASSKRSFIHLSNFYGKFIELIAKRKIISKFYEKKNKDFQELDKLQIQFKLSVTTWPLIPKKFREYEHLQKYVPTPFNRTQKIQQRLESLKVPVQCPQNCVCYKQDLKNNEEFCNYSLAQVWQSSCPNRKAKIECNHQDLIKAEKCRNSEIKNKQRKKVKLSQNDQNCQIQQFMAWGIDLFTRNMILNCLPEIDVIDFGQFQRNHINKNNFVEKTLQKALNFIGENGYNLNDACQFIIKNGPQITYPNNGENKKHIWRSKNHNKIVNILQANLFNGLEVQYAKNLLRNKLYVDTQFPNNQFFRIHTKGKGAKCIVKQGIKRGTFIVQYFGEIYEPWRWYQRQDFIKQVLKKKKLKQVIPQFYNIYLQKHKDQPLGYDILVVDPIKKGNFSSRFSHSCTPNCGTVSTVSDGRYVIGMYSIKDIQYGEQFTFDYCSMTQSSYQHTHSICLCGTKSCRGNYLQLANNKMYNNLMDNNSCFHYRNSLMLKSLEKVTQKQLQICYKSNLKDGMLKELPSWMVKWSSIILQCIQKEGELYRQQLKQNWTKQYPWQSKNESPEEKMQKIELYSKISKDDLITLRYQNLITTIDKLKYYLESIQDSQPPLHYQSRSKICEVLIQNKNKDSILIILQDQCMNEKMKEESILIQEFLKKIRSYDLELKNNKHTFDQVQVQELLKKKLFLFRLCCLCVSHQIMCKATVSNMSNRLLLSDIVYFYAFTHTYFTPHQYKTHTSEEIKVTLQEILGESCSSKFSDKTRKRYTSPCVWGQMVSWFKQTIVNPEASLSQDRRGTLSYPLINSILKSTYPFQKHVRSSFLKTIREKPASSWPPAQGCELSYKNPYKCYGTMLFQNVHNRQAFKELSKQNLIDSVLDIINNSLSQKLKLFKKVQQIIQGIEQSNALYQILSRLNINMQQMSSQQMGKGDSIGQKANGKKKVKLQERIQVMKEQQQNSRGSRKSKNNAQQRQERIERRQLNAKGRSRSRGQENNNSNNSNNSIKNKSNNINQEMKIQSDINVKVNENEGRGNDRNIDQNIMQEQKELKQEANHEKMMDEGKEKSEMREQLQEEKKSEEVYQEVEEEEKSQAKKEGHVEQEQGEGDANRQH